jgi:hypothetical protein
VHPFIEGGYRGIEQGGNQESLDISEKCLVDWYRQGIDGGWDAIKRTAEAEIGRMAGDKDFSWLLCDRLKTLKKEIPSRYWPPRSRGGGRSHNCLLANASVATPDGSRFIGDLRPGDTVYSVRLGTKLIQVSAIVKAVVTSTAFSCIQLNDEWVATPGQRVRSVNGWVRVGSLKIGDRVRGGDGGFVRIENVTKLNGYFTVYDLSISGPHHNYVANGVLCHNKKL